MRVALVGCGFLGSLWSEEVFKRLFAIDRLDVEFRFVDMDDWEPRNAANQLITPVAAKSGKAEWMQNRSTLYGLEATHEHMKVEEGAMIHWMSDIDVLVDAVDNYETRKVLWGIAAGAKVPCLHLGINGLGSGVVEWSYTNQHYEGWHLSPVRLVSPPPVAHTELPSLAPCHLVQQRGLGLNLALAGAKAFTLYLKEDVEEVFQQGPQIPDSVLTPWEATNYGHNPNFGGLHVCTEAKEQAA